MGTRKRAELIELACARAQQPDKPRLVETGPLCAWGGCRKPFRKVRPHQKYCTDSCRYHGWLDSSGRTRAARNEQ
jgi:hypothetical protein